MKHTSTLFIATIICCTVMAINPARYSIIPQPFSLQESEGVFSLNKNTVINIPEGNKNLLEIAEDFANQFNKVSGINLQIIENNQTEKQSNSIVFRKAENMAEEAYKLSISQKKIIITATTPNGIFYGIQTIKQLLPPDIFGEKKAGRVRWEIPCCEIEDAPRFSYRGLMLDVGRYFMPKEFILKFIDIMAMHKQNMFHWHLTEDQGWRIEIKKYPLLTEIGSIRKETAGYYPKEGDGVPHGGFYTQEDVKEIVEYARRRYVTVIPEIELPGHATAAIAAYPELSCFPEREYEVATRWGIKKDVFCPTATTFGFLEDVFTELFDIFPSPYYHIGGDECPRDHWKECSHCQNLMKILGIKSEDDLQIFFVKRISRFLREKGNKTVIGWDEIIDGGYVPGTVVMSYRGHNPAFRAAKLGLETIITANRWNYLDYYQEDPVKEEKSQGLFLPLSKVYNYYPIPDSVPQQYHQYYIGQQGCVWTEFIQNEARAEYKTFPRSIAMSEVAWCHKDKKDWDSFCRRMQIKGFARLDMKNVNYSRAFYNVIFHFDDKNTTFPQEINLSIDYPDAQIFYTINGKSADKKSNLYADPISVNKGDVIRAQAFTKDGKRIGKPVDKTF